MKFARIRDRVTTKLDELLYAKLLELEPRGLQAQTEKALADWIVNVVTNDDFTEEQQDEALNTLWRMSKHVFGYIGVVTFILGNYEDIVTANQGRTLSEVERLCISDANARMIKYLVTPITINIKYEQLESGFQRLEAPIFGLIEQIKATLGHITIEHWLARHFVTRRDAIITSVFDNKLQDVPLPFGDYIL